MFMAIFCWVSLTLFMLGCDVDFDCVALSKNSQKLVPFMQKTFLLFDFCFLLLFLFVSVSVSCVEELRREDTSKTKLEWKRRNKEARQQGSYGALAKTDAFFLKISDPEEAVGQALEDAGSDGVILGEFSTSVLLWIT